MSTWISRVAGLLGVAAVLAGCVPAGTGGGSAPRAISVADGLVVTGPPGYCVDRSASRDGASGAFVLIGTCAALSGRAGAGQPANPAVLTVSVLPGSGDRPLDADTFPAMARFFRSEPGRAALSRSGRAGTVKVLDVVSQRDVLYLQIRDSATFLDRAVETDYWRANLGIGGRIVTVSALGLSNNPLAPAEKRRVLEAAIRALRAANAGKPAAS